MNDVRLRLLALERGETINNPPTTEEIREALLARIGARSHAITETTKAVKAQQTKPNKKKKTTTKPNLSGAADL